MIQHERNPPHANLHVAVGDEAHDQSISLLMRQLPGSHQSCREVDREAQVGAESCPAF